MLGDRRPSAKSLSRRCELVPSTSNGTDMNPLAPTSHGLGLLVRRPRIPLAEIAWRWSFAAAAWILAMMFLFEYMGTLRVSPADRLLLRTGQPELIARAIHRIFEGSAFRFTKAGVLLGLGLTVAWIVLASLGRAATVHAVLEDLGLAPPPQRGGVKRSIMALNALRATTMLAALVGIVGATFIASSFWSATRISPGDAARLFFLILFFVWLAWAVMNWLLSLSAISVVTEHQRALAALDSCVRLCQREPGAVFSTGALFGLMHGGAFIAACGTGFTIMGALAGFAPRLTWLTLLLLIALYCTVADFLYTGRLAAYVLILRGEEATAIMTPPVVPTVPVPGARSPVDPNELILSDVPLPAS
jgi:hypothetical protein